MYKLKNFFIAFLIALISITSQGQGLQRFTNHEIVVSIAPRTIAGVQLQRKAHCNTISIEPDVSKVTLYIDVYYVDTAEINDPARGIIKYTRQSVADMSTIVDVSDPTSPYFGMPLISSTQEYLTDSTGTHLNPALTGKAYMFEYEFFRMLMQQPVKVYDLAVSKIQYAAMTGKLD